MRKVTNIFSYYIQVKIKKLFYLLKNNTLQSAITKERLILKRWLLFLFAKSRRAERADSKTVCWLFVAHVC